MTQSTKIRQDGRCQRCLNQGLSEDSCCFCKRKVSAFLPNEVKFKNNTIQTLSEQIINRCFFVPTSKLLNKHFGLTDWGRIPHPPLPQFLLPTWFWLHADTWQKATVLRQARGRYWRSCAVSFGVCFVLPRFSSEMLMKGFVEADRNLTD